MSPISNLLCPVRFKLSPVKLLLALVLVLSLSLSLVACDQAAPFTSGDSQSGQKTFDVSFGPAQARQSLSLVSGSENAILEPLLQEFANQSGLTINIDYLGSLDIMRLLQEEVFPYDAVWPASSLWLSVGDSHHRVKHASSISLTPVIFGIRDSLAQELGFKDKEVLIRDILSAIQAGKLRFTMTSATQSNSGASAYIGFLYALLENPSSLELADLADADLRQQITSLLAGVERSSGSSNWLVDLFISGNYDAMVNYEALIISANQILESQGRETLYAVYPQDGLTLADSPLGFVADSGQADRDQEAQEKIFLDLQNFLLSEDSQAKIQATGRRTDMLAGPQGLEEVFRPAWGIDLDRHLTTMRMPKAEVILEALQLYQSEFKKPAYNIYLLDFSGSMSGKGHKQLLAALEAIMLEENARANLLQASREEINSFIAFSSGVEGLGQAQGSGEDLEKLYHTIKAHKPSGATHLYSALDQALTELGQVNLDQYRPAIILMSDGAPTWDDLTYADIAQHYADLAIDVPIFSILFGDAHTEPLEELAELSRARVFDGREDLIAAFQKVRGYN
ncbi:MAG: VWA domain-containing protein [Eubacteriales bacterium]|nr:VWA domain-containing protein [Eubacteriales bacterium]